ncbi:hypothetical protein TGRH88_076750 [Toxoplasma gondii]|uniref:Uncharacterized protein n=1 Tax=Toxoplasma gondii TaxID=5811 RepID=A0A7J6K337_TOXGO|nr:hypothetical protein TGRH88_076750 [Toxoplasma gondii]
MFVPEVVYENNDVTRGVLSCYLASLNCTTAGRAVHPTVLRLASNGDPIDVCADIGCVGFLNLTICGGEKKFPNTRLERRGEGHSRLETGTAISRFYTSWHRARGNFLRRNTR